MSYTDYDLRACEHDRAENTALALNILAKAREDIKNKELSYLMRYCERIEELGQQNKKLLCLQKKIERYLFAPQWPPERWNQRVKQLNKHRNNITRECKVIRQNMTSFIEEHSTLK